MDTDLKKIIDETIEQFFENAPIKMIEKGVREETFDVCPHCKKEIYEKHEYTEDGGKTWRHSDCKGLIRRPPLDPASIPDWLRPYMDNSLNEYFGSDPSKIGIESGEKKYSEQEPGGQMAAVNCNETAFRVYNETLCPALWDEQQHLDPEVRLNLLRMAQDFYEKTKFTAPILDVYLMGSIANYNWTPDSDADVHVIIDFTQLQMPNETASKVAKSAGAQWNLEHNATVKGHKVEINIQSVKAEKPHVTGIYSLMKDAWIRKPTKMNVQVNKPLIQVHYTEIKKFVESAIQSGDREKMKTAKDYLDDYRQHGLDTAGELSTQNIVYKILRAKGLIKTLKDAIIVAYDKEMSVDEAEAPTMTKKDYIGSIIDGEVRGEPVPAGKVKFYMHNDFPGLISGMNSTNWRYNAEKNRVLWNTQPEEESKSKVTDFLTKRGIVNPIHKNMYNFEEVTQADIKDRHPHPFAPQKLSPDNELVPDLEMMTLDNLKSLMKKAGREWRYARAHEDSEGCKRALEKSKLFHDEIKRRLAYINKPVAEMANISLQGKQAFANDNPLKNATVEDVSGNVVLFRSDTGGFFAPGFTLVYFMDSDESAQAMKDGKIPYLMVPRGTFHSGGNPITDIWKKKFQKPGTEHILGVVEGNSNENEIYIDMITVRPGWQRNSIARKMIEILKKNFPKAKLETSSTTDKGAKFFKAVNESVGYERDPNYRSSADFLERRDRQMCEIATFLKENPGTTPIPWKTIPASLLKKTWLIFGKRNIVHENAIDKIADQILTNIARLYVSNEFAGHSTNYHMPEEVLENCGIEFSEKEWDKNCWRFENISDYGMKPLQKIYHQIFEADTPEEKLYACDRALNVVHQRSDLASIFVEGGTATLNAVAEQGGYDSGYSYGDVNRMMQKVNERMVHSFETDYGRGPTYVEIFQNPTTKELRECKPHYEIGALLTDKDIYVWNREKAYHNNVKTQLKLPEALSLMLIPDNSNINRMDILVTDAVKGTKWDNNPQTENFIRNHPFFRGKQIDQIMYWNEDIVGDWSALKDEVAEGYGAGVPEDDRLHIPDHRWQIRSKDAPKTPKMPSEQLTETEKEAINELVDQVIAGML
jgi:hypothetical protein